MEKKWVCVGYIMQARRSKTEVTLKLTGRQSSGAGEADTAQI